MAEDHERLNPLDDPEGFDDFAESQEPEPPFDLFDDSQEENILLPHQLAFRQFVNQHRIDPAAFTDTSMFRYDLIRPVNTHSADTVVSVPQAQTDHRNEVLSTSPFFEMQTQATFSQTGMPDRAQQERVDRLRSISPLILAHLNNGDITEQNLNSFLRKVNTMQYQ